MKKHKKRISILAAALLVCLTVVGCGKKDQQAQDPAETQPSAEPVLSEVTAANEQELRQLLAEDAELVIHVSDDMEVREGFVVNGTKTLMGDAEIKMALGAELGQSLLSLSADSALTLDGPVLHCNYNADGIYVEAGAELTCLSGSVKYAGAYGILTYGDVTVEDISIEDCEFISICAQTGSRVNVKGGTIRRSSSNDVYVVGGAYVNISGDTEMEGALEHAMINYGTLEIHGGKFGNVNNYLCDNYGELTVAYKGQKQDGVVEFYGARNSIFLVRKGSTASFSDVYIHDTERQGIASLGGDTEISNCKFENTGSHSIDIQGGKATVENVVITGSKKSGLEASNSAKVTVKNFTVNSCDNIGIASRGATITATDIAISNTGKYGLTCGDTKTGDGVIEVTNATVTKATANSIYVYENGVARLKNISVSDGEARGIYVAKTASCTITGDSSFKNMAKGGVEVRGKLKLEGVTICNNNTKNSGAGAYVADGGELTLIDGAIYNNTSALRGGGVCVSDATLTVRGTNIYNNRAANHGGGMYVQKTSLVSLQSGKITKNRSGANGDGIYILSAESQMKVAEDFYLGGNDIKVDNPGAYVKFTRNSMKYHSASDPILLTPNYDAPEGTMLAICNSESIAKSIAVASGDGSYEVIRSGRKFVTKFAVADMDMTGADTVEVSSFQQLKTAVESTTSKRNIILTDDIEFPERIRLPGGVTINIQDDGTQRTLTRKNGFTDSFFVTHYGTGLKLTGSEEGKLVLDGGYTAEADAQKRQSLIRVAGSTELTNVTLQNNGSLLAENAVRGALVRQLYGDIKIYNSVLSNGKAYTGGAVMIDQGEAYIESSTLTGNASTIGGGAVRVAENAQLKVVSSSISSNHAGSTGGGIVAVGAAQVTAVNTTFENNTAASYGGAVSAQDSQTLITLEGTDGNAVFKNNSAPTAGAVYAVKEAKLVISGYTFESNAATGGRAGAISVLDHSSASIANTAFYNNTATASAGALSVDGSTVTLTSCVFGKEGAGNTAGDKAGAILVTQGAVVEMTVAEGAAGSVSYNTAAGEYGGGAVYVDADSTLSAKGYVFEGNQAVSGGAIYVAAGATVKAEAGQFIKNAANAKNGGAVYCAGIYEDVNSSYTENEAARNGGAIIVMSGGNATLTATDGVMTANKAGVNNGGAVFVNGGGKATITGYTLTGNTGGGVQVQADASAQMNEITFADETGNGIYVNGKLTFGKLTGAHILQTNADATFTVTGYAVGSIIEFTPKTYEKNKVVLTKDEEMTDADFQTACAGITVTPNAGEAWYIDNLGRLKKAAVVNATTADGVTEGFDSLEEAVAFANGKDSAVKIEVSGNITVNETLTIEKNISIVNASGKEITVSRSADLTGDMFQVSPGAALTLGADVTAEGDALIIDGASASAIAGRTVTVESGATFTLNKNATLQNAKSSLDGGAIYTASANTYVYGTIQDNVGKTGAGMRVAKDPNAAVDAKVRLSGASFLRNRSSGTGGALQIDADAKVEAANTRFEDNKALTGITYSNGGAIYVAGAFTDTNSSYLGNMGKNGGAIFLGANTAVVTLTGSDAQFKDNTATGATNSRGGAIFVNGGSVSVDGYTFEGNTSAGTDTNTAEGAVHIATGSATIKNAVFQGTAAQKIYVLGGLTFEKLTGAKLVQAKDGANITLSADPAGTNVQIAPYSYTEGAVVIKGTEVDFRAIAVTQGSDGKYWTIDEGGKLKSVAAGITTDGVTQYYASLNDAVAAAAEGAQIEVLGNTTLTETVEITKNVTIVNASGKNVTISRGSLAADMFAVNGGSLTLGRSSGGALIIDGTSADAIAARTVTVASGAAFTLNANATLQGANSTVTGGALQSAGTTYLYGTVSNNYSTKDGAGVEVTGGTVTIDGAVFSGNKGGSTCAGAALCIKSGATVNCSNASFTGNEVPNSKNGGAIYCAGTFTDTNSTYTGNKAKNGGAIFIAGGTVELTGTDAAKAVFQSNEARDVSNGKNGSRGGAIYLNGGTLTVSGYAFKENTSVYNTTVEDTAVWKASGTMTLTDVTFA